MAAEYLSTFGRKDTADKLTNRCIDLIVEATGAQGNATVNDHKASIWYHEYCQRHSISPAEDFTAKALKYLSCTLATGSISKMKLRAREDLLMDVMQLDAINGKKELVAAMLGELVKTFTVPDKFNNKASVTRLPEN